MRRKFAGISGNKDGLEQIPDGEFLPPMEMNCIEKHLQQSINENYKGRHLVISRTANLSKQLNERGPCQYRDLCYRGCPFGGYFSSNASTIPAAQFDYLLHQNFSLSYKLKIKTLMKMSGQILFITLALCAGMMIPFQSAMNAQLGKAILSAYYAALTVFIFAVIGLLIYILAMRYSMPSSQQFNAAQACDVNNGNYDI